MPVLGQVSILQLIESYYNAARERAVLVKLIAGEFLHAETDFK